MTLLDIEIGASKSDMLVTEFKDNLWLWCMSKQSKAKVRKLARELNIYPAPANVYYHILKYLFAGTSIKPSDY